MKIGNRTTGKDAQEGQDENRKVLDPFKEVEPIPVPPPAPDGGPNMARYLGEVEPIPAATPENFICLRGPCKNYVEIHSFAEVESRGLSHTPKQINRLCRVIPGTEIDLTDDCVFHCSEWTPLLPGEMVERNRRRALYQQAVQKGKKRS